MIQPVDNRNHSGKKLPKRPFEDQAGPVPVKDKDKDKDKNKGNGKLALCVNPMSGRDVRRLAARATNMTHEAKRDIVARVAAGADAAGVTDIYIAREPFRIASMALDLMPLKARVHIIDIPLTNSAQDTEVAVKKFKEAGCHTMVSLGGDGTNRAIARACSDIDLVPISTGTNNVFPALMEPTVGGMVAGLNALGLLDQADPDLRLKQAVKVLHLRGPHGDDVGLIDAVLIRNDHVGNLLPFDADRLDRMVLTRAEPNSIGMSPIGGFIDPIYTEDDCGLVVVMDADMGPSSQRVMAPLSPGLYRDVGVQGTSRVDFDTWVTFVGPGVVALDGDRDHKLLAAEEIRVCVRRDGPRVLNVERVMRWAVAAGIMTASSVAD